MFLALEVFQHVIQMTAFILQVILGKKVTCIEKCTKMIQFFSTTNTVFWIVLVRTTPCQRRVKEWTAVTRSTSV